MSYKNLNFHKLFIWKIIFSQKTLSTIFIDKLKKKRIKVNLVLQISHLTSVSFLISVLWFILFSIHWIKQLSCKYLFPPEYLFKLYFKNKFWYAMKILIFINSFSLNHLIIFNPETWIVFISKKKINLIWTLIYFLWSNLII